jgi:hypothetical protein
MDIHVYSRGAVEAITPFDVPHLRIPRRGRRLFFFTEPAVPDGWHSARKALTGSVVFVYP